MKHLTKIKNKILDNLPAIFITLVFVFGITLTYNHATAIPNSELQPKTGPGSKTEPEYPFQYNLNKLVQQQIPVYCGETGFIYDTSANVMMETQILIGEVRRGGMPSGDLIGILSFGHSIERGSGTFFMTIPGIGPNNESMTCILGYGLNWKFFEYDGSEVIRVDSL